MALTIISQQNSENDESLGARRRNLKNVPKELKITKISAQVKRSDRCSVYVNEKYAFSLHEYQLADSGLRVGKVITTDDLKKFANESQFGKAYERALRYVMLRPHSEKEIKDYLTRTFLYPKPKYFLDKNGDRHLKKQTVDVPEATAMIERVMTRLNEKKYINDEAFARAWVSSRQQLKKASIRKLKQELQVKGITSDIIAKVLQNSEETEKENLRAIISKKQKLHRYQDTVKLTQYLLRQGYNYDDIKDSLR
jgi:regulatory protein